jgi:hypothetical protein
MSPRPPSLLLASLMLVLLAGCTGGKRPALSENLVARCEYTGANSKMPECKEYLGAWTLEKAQADCRSASGSFTAAEACAVPEALGACLLGGGEEQSRILLGGADVPTEKCASSRTGCELFGGGFWEPAGRCGGADELVVLTNAFPQPRRVCSAPKAGEPAGRSEGGQVCTWEGMHGAVEEGRAYTDYASCDVALRQRPYRAVPPNARALQEDPRLADPAYVAEQEWVRSQTRSQSCTCCHSQAAPSGPAVFDVDRPGSFANQFNDRGLAQGAGWVSTVPLGAFPGAQNNGFQKSDAAHPDFSAFMSTDPERMRGFFARELAYRGLTREDFAGKPDGLGPLSEQLRFRPSACSAEERVDADGTVRWKGGQARYVYVLEAAAQTPTIPPNLDLPEGTLWRLDVPEDGAPLRSGTVRYGAVPAGARQRFPTGGGAPAPLVSGRPYYLYASADVLMPLSRCLFTAP